MQENCDRKTRIPLGLQLFPGLFVPFTKGSELARRMREAENTLQYITGYRIQIVERSGQNLEDILTKSDPWQGQDCGRELCLLCKTKQATGKQSTQDCRK